MNPIESDEQSSGSLAALERLWVVFKVSNQSFGLPARSIREMVTLPDVVALPAAADYVRGMVAMRGHTLPLIDLRVRLGMPSLATERAALIAMFSEREQDHRNWLKELEACVTEERPFTLSLDPHGCGFGRWYDHYHTEDRLLASLLRQFDKPHQQIHAIAAQVMELCAEHRREEALEIVSRTRDIELAQLIRLFRQAQAHVRESNREIALVMDTGRQAVALAVDGVEAVETLQIPEAADVADMLERITASLAMAVGQRPKTNEVVILLESRQLGEDGGLPPREALAAAGA